MRRSLTLLLAFMMVLGVAGLALAQYAPTYTPQQEQIHALIMMRLTNALHLNESQAKQLGAIMSKYHAQRMQLRQKLQGLTGQLQASSASGNEVQIKALVANIDKTKKELDNCDDEMFTEAKKMLTLQQQAQFLLVMDEIHREIRAIRGGGQYGPGPGGNYPTGASQSDSVWVK
jgi:multidrug efflux pump subunit AcrB